MSVITERNDIVTNTLDTIGPIVASDLEFVKRDIQKVQDKLGPALVKSNNDTKAVMIYTTLVVLLAIGLATLITRQIQTIEYFVINGLNGSSSEVHTSIDSTIIECRSSFSTIWRTGEFLEATSTSLQQMVAMTNRNAENARDADKFMDSTKTILEEANASMEKLQTAMIDILNASKETSGIIKTIDEIAFQTNLLALNASVEAARAGDAGLQIRCSCK